MVSVGYLIERSGCIANGKSHFLFMWLDEPKERQSIVGEIDGARMTIPLKPRRRIQQVVNELKTIEVGNLV